MKDFAGFHLNGTQTEKNLQAALGGEALARSQYAFFAEQALAEGHESIADLYRRMETNELMHCKIWYQYLHGGIYPTMVNVQNAVQGEMMESQKMYPDFARVAREEGFEEIAEMFDSIGAIEHSHANVFLQALSTLTQRNAGITHVPDTMPKDEYRCMFCGATFEYAPEYCPVCDAMDAFELVNDFI